MTPACCKVGQVTDQYRLTVPGEMADEVDDYLAARWTGDGGFSAVGYRPLAVWFNKRLLRKVYVEHDRSPTETRIDAEYETLTGDDDLRRQELVDDLDRDGIDGDALLDAFVSRTTMARHLKDCLDVRKDRRRASAESTWELDRIGYGRQQFADSAAAAVSSLTNKGRLPGGTDAEIELPVMLACPDCATRVSLSTALQRGYICADHLGRRDDRSSG